MQMAHRCDKSPDSGVLMTNIRDIFVSQDSTYSPPYSVHLPTTNTQLQSCAAYGVCTGSLAMGNGEQGCRWRERSHGAGETLTERCLSLVSSVITELNDKAFYPEMPPCFWRLSQHIPCPSWMSLIEVFPRVDHGFPGSGVLSSGSEWLASQRPVSKELCWLCGPQTTCISIINAKH